MGTLDDIFDTGMDIITFGMYKGVKGVTDGASQSIKEVGDDVAKSITGLTNKTLMLMSDLDAIFINVDGLFCDQSKTKRSDNDLSPNELSSIRLLREAEGQIVTQFNRWGVKTLDDDTLQFFLNWKSEISIDLNAHGAMPPGWTTSQMDLAKYYAQKLGLIRGAINKILYKGTGVVPETFSNLQSVLSRVNTEEQPRLEKMLDDVDMTLRGTSTTVDNVNGLFYNTQKPPRNKSELSPDELSSLTFLRNTESNLVNFFHGRGVSGTIDESSLAIFLNWKSDPYMHGAMPVGWTEDQMDEAQYYAKKLLLTRQAINSILYKNTGVIPETLSDVKTILNRINAEEQPRIEKLIDNVNTTVSESQTVLKSVNSTVSEAKVVLADLDLSVKKINGGLNLFSKYKIPILIVIGFTTIVWVAISVLILIIMVKILLGPNPL